MKQPVFSPERIALPSMMESIEERFDASLGSTWRDKPPSTPREEGSNFFSIEALLRLLQHDPSQLKPHHRLRIWFSIEKQHPATQSNLLALTSPLWREAYKARDFSILYLMIQRFFAFLQENNETTDALPPQATQMRWPLQDQKDFMRSLLMALATDDKKQPFLIIKRVKEWFPLPDPSVEEIKKAALRFHDFCSTKKTPQEALESMNLPSQGDFTNTVLELCREKLTQEVWPNWAYLLWVFRAFQAQDRFHYMTLVNHLLEKTPDPLLQKCHDEFFSHLRQEFGHPLSSESDWKFFSEKARSRMLSWGGKVQYDDYNRVHLILKEMKFYEYINSLTQHKHAFGADKLLQSRYGKYWKQYTSKMRMVRFYLTPVAREWLGKHDEGPKVLRESGLGQCIGQMDSASDAMLMEFEPFVVIEFIYGSFNHALFFTKSIFQTHQELFLRNELILSEVLKLKRLNTIQHPYLWQKDCDKFMLQNKIYKDHEAFW